MNHLKFVMLFQELCNEIRKTDWFLGRTPL